MANDNTTNNSTTSNSNSSKNGFLSAFGDALGKQIRSKAEDTTYYKQIVQQKYSLIEESNGAEKNIKDACESTKTSSQYISETYKVFTDSVINTNKTIIDVCDVITKTMNEFRSFVGRTKTAELSTKSSNIKARVVEEGTKIQETKTEEAKTQETKIEENIGEEFSQALNKNKQQMSVGESIFALALDQVISIVGEIEKEVKLGRKEAAETYEANVAEVVSRGVSDKYGYMFETSNISNELLKNDLYANLNTNEIYKGYTELVKQGYSDEDATRMAMEDAIESKIAPYLDTSSTAFKDLQNKFGDQFLNQISGINNYIQDIAGSAKVWEANANTIISSLEPVQLWAEQQNWGEEELGALEWLTEEGGMTQTEASQLIQEALKVSTDQYGSITSGTVAQKVAVATGQTDFGDALTSLLKTSTLASNSNSLVQGAAANAMGVRGFSSEAADLNKRFAMYQEGLEKSESSTNSPEEETNSLLSSLTSGDLTSTSEAEANISSNTGSTFAFLQEMFPTITDKLDSILTTEKIISVATSTIATLEAKETVANGTSKIVSALGDMTESIGTKVSGLSESLSGSLSGIVGSLGSIGGYVAIGFAAVAAIAAALWGVNEIIKASGDAKYDSNTIQIASVKSKGVVSSPSSYDVGSSYIDKDQLAYIHKGEGVLTSQENKEYQQNKTTIKKLAEGNIQVTVEQEEKNDKLISEVRELKQEILKAMATYNTKEKTYTYNSKVVNLTNENDT